MDSEQGFKIIINPFASGRYFSLHLNAPFLLLNISQRVNFILVSLELGTAKFKAKGRVLNFGDWDSHEGGEAHRAEPDTVSVQLQ